MPISAFADILVKRLSDEQIGTILQAVTADITDGACPVCGEEEIPVDADGNEIEDDDVSMAEEWREQHDADCIITLIEDARLCRATPDMQAKETK
jgi:hypothetical protein